MFKTLFEDPSLEIARLAAAPEGSINHAMSLLPVLIHGVLDDLMIELPDTDLVSGIATRTHTIIVVPFLRHVSEDEKNTPPSMPFKLHRGYWDCIVVASDSPSYPVGGHRINVSESQLVRGILRTFDLTSSSAA